MAESVTTPPEEAVSGKSPLEKPLHELTEDDIAQVTREDCRRYLKQKGMRRPSWNKSQAIQQVIMLKALLETPAESDAGFRKKFRISRPNKFNSASESVPQGTCEDMENYVPADNMSPFGLKDLDMNGVPFGRKDLDMNDVPCGRKDLDMNDVPFGRKDLDMNDVSCGFSGQFAAANDGSALPRTTGSTNLPVGQMTIFYCGKVNVYDDVPTDKARAIMHMSASQQKFPPEQPVDGAILKQPSPYLSKAVQTVKMCDNFRAISEEINMLHEENPGVEGPSSRKASVQRYLDKRKDRFKSKRKAGIATSCASLDVYFHHQTANQMLTNDPLSGGDMCSPTQIRSPSAPTRCSSVDNESVKNVCAYSGLNNRGS